MKISHRIAFFLLLLSAPVYGKSIEEGNLRRVQDNGDGTIIGGNPADQGEYPSYGASLGSPFLCGGTLIHPDIVLTAAHCNEADPDFPAFPEGGVWQQGGIIRGEDDAEYLEIEAFRIHPLYNRAATNLQNDLVRKHRKACSLHFVQLFSQILFRSQMLLKLRGQSSAPLQVLNTDPSLPAVVSGNL